MILNASFSIITDIPEFFTSRIYIVGPAINPCLPIEKKTLQDSY